MAKDNLTFRVGLDRHLYFSEADRNIDSLLYWSGLWTAGTYARNEVVFWEGGVWVCVAESTTDEPENTSTDWELASPTPGLATANLGTPAGITIDGGWSTVPFDTERHTSYGMILDTVANTWSPIMLGMWELRIELDISFPQAQQGRTTSLRTYNVTDDVASGPEANIYIGRNQDGLNFAATIRRQIYAADLGDAFRLEIGGGDTVSGATVNGVGILLQQISPRDYT